MKPIIAISMGDYNGIGPEVILKALPYIDLSASTPLIIGHQIVFDYYSSRLNLSCDIEVIRTVNEAGKGESACLVNCLNKKQFKIEPGRIAREAGRSSMLAVEYGANLCLRRKASALVTAPISKEAIRLAGYQFSGHTDFLAHRASVEETMMLMISDELRIGLLTSHIPLAAVNKYITVENVLHMIRMLHRTVRMDFGIEQPRLAVLGLNPHAGDGGVIGTEEQRIISPALERAKMNNIDVLGPYSADGFFGNRTFEKFDGILAMYHDQGLIPFKTISFGRGVNFTAGLPFVRTSPDHGTAFDLAGHGDASPDSFISAYNLVCKLTLNRMKR